MRPVAVLDRSRPSIRWRQYAAASVALAATAVVGSGALLAAPSGATPPPGAAVAPGIVPSGSTTAQPSQPAPLSQSYSLLTAAGSLVGYGGALSAPSGSPSSPVAGVAPTTDGRGAWIAEADGAVVAIGDAAMHGSLVGTSLASAVVGIAADPRTGGYWLVAADGGVFAFDAPYLGSTGAMHLNAPIVAMAATADGGGYWLVAADGGIFAYGDARYLGSTGAMHLNAPIVAMAATADGGGYWLVAADGGVFAFGQAPFFGSGAGSGAHVVGIIAADGGYQNPLRAVAGLQAERIDQGVDYAGSGPVYALGDGVVTSTVNPGWPGGAFIAYRLIDGPAAGRYVYVAENLTPQVKIGEHVTSSTVVGILHDAYPDMETGWAAPPGDGQALAGAAGIWTAAADQASVPTSYGENFSQLLSALGAPPGVATGQPSGTLPAGWPTW